MLITRHLRATGLVQGVGFRDAMIIEAIALGIRGWVRNRADGSVEAVLHGEASDVERMIDWAHRGSPAARVDHLSIIDTVATGFAGQFELRPTL